jgi:hypothetical protein
MFAALERDDWDFLCAILFQKMRGIWHQSG